MWTVDLKTTGTVLKGSFRQADVVLDAADDTFLQIASGRISSLKAFETGKLTVRGNLALVNKLDSVLKVCATSARYNRQRTNAMIVDPARKGRSEEVDRRTG